MNRIIAQSKKIMLVACVAISMNSNAARVEKCVPCQEKIAAANAAKLSIQAVQAAALVVASRSLETEIALDLTHLVANEIASTSCAEGVAQVSLQDALETSLAAAEQDAIALVTIDATNEALNTIEADIAAYK